MGMGSKFDNPVDLSKDYTIAIACGDLNCGEDDSSATVTVTIVQGQYAGSASKDFPCDTPGGEWMLEVRARLKQPKPDTPEGARGAELQRARKARKEWLAEWEDAKWREDSATGTGSIVYHKYNATDQPERTWGPQQLDLERP